MKYIQFEFATGKKNIVPMMNKTAIKQYIKKYQFVNGGVCGYKEINKQDACMFDSYNRFYNQA